MAFYKHHLSEPSQDSTSAQTSDKLPATTTGIALQMIEHEASINERIWQVVAAIPPGRVSTYGDVAQRAGLPGAARRVGKALRELPGESRIPWHRVINAGGRISLPKDTNSHHTQRERLEEEGVGFRTSGTIDLHRYGW